MLLKILVVVASLTQTSLATEQVPLRVAAFNIKTFGASKMSDSVVANRIVQIVSRFDIILIQEVRDASGDSLETLKTLLGPDDWDYVASERLGRTPYYKEQYVYFYRAAAVSVTGKYQYDDTANDVFEREPFSIEIQYYSVRRSGLRNVALVGLHARPDDAPSELKHFAGVIEIVYDHFTDSDGVIAMGDFNADCSYLDSTTRDSLEIFNCNAGFSSKIAETADSTSYHSTDCAYDRVVTYGVVDVRDAAVYNFETEIGLTEEAAKDISGHYPVEFSLY